MQVVQALLITPPRKPKSHRLVKGCGGEPITAVVRPIARPVIRCGVARITVATVSIARWCGVVNPSRNAGSAWLIPLHSETRHLAPHRESLPAPASLQSVLQIGPMARRSSHRRHAGRILAMPLDVAARCRFFSTLPFEMSSQPIAAIQQRVIEHRTQSGIDTLPV